MGGSSKSAAPATTTPAATTRPTTTVPAAMPGQLDALSAQLAAGFGQSQPDILALLNQYYRPMKIPDYSTPYTSTQDPAKAPAVRSAGDWGTPGYGE